MGKIDSLEQIGREWTVPVDVHAGGRRVIDGPDARAALVFADHDRAAEVLGSRDLLALAEAYVHGAVEIQGDIFAVVMIRDQFYPDTLSFLDKARIVLTVLKSYRRHRVEDDGEYISHHYDQPDEFYELFLGPTMMYSCAYFADDADRLDDAQEQKLDHLLTKLKLCEGETILDIGCGWGSLVIRAAERYGARAHGITLSKAQHDYANAKIERLGLAGRCSVELRDYREMPPGAQYDKIVSVGMYEHVGHRNLDRYFEKVSDLLKPDGLFVNHGITRKNEADWKRYPEARFMDKYIFPGGELYPSGRVVAGMEKAGFEVYDVESLRKHYVRTLRNWVGRLEMNSERALAIAPPQTYRAWRLYMAGCANAFEEGYLNVHQVCGSKSTRFGGHKISMTRDHIYQDSRYKQ